MLLSSLLAQLDASDMPEAVSIAAWLLGFAAVLTIADKAIRFAKDHLGEKPKPSETYATIPQHRDLQRTLSDHINHTDERFHTFEAKLEKTIRDSDIHRETAYSKLESKMDDNAKEAKSDVKDLRKDIKDLHERIDPLVAGVSKLIGRIEK